MLPAPSTPKETDGVNATPAEHTARGTKIPVTLPPVVETDEDVFSPTADGAGAFGFAGSEQIVRDTEGSPAHSAPSNHSLSVFLDTNTPPLSTRLTVLRGVPGSDQAVGPRSAIVGSVCHAEADTPVSWPSLPSGPASLNAPPMSSVTVTAAPRALAANAGPDLVKDTPVSDKGSSHSAPSSAATSPTAAVAAPATGAVPTSNAASHYKTKCCRHFDQTGWCPYQHRCVFAHGDREFTRYNMQRSLNSVAADGSGPTTSQVVREHIERNVRQLIDEYEEAVTEASAKAAANGPSASTDKNALSGTSLSTALHGASPTHSSSAQPGAWLAQSALMTAHHSTARTQPHTVPSQSAPPYQQIQFLQAPPPPPPPQQQQQQPFPMLARQSVFLSAMPGSPSAAAVYTMLPSQPSLNVAGPQPLNTFAAHPLQQVTQQQQQQQQVVFSIPPGAPALYSFQPQQQQIFLVGAPYLPPGATSVVAYPNGAAPYPGALMTRFA